MKKNDSFIGTVLHATDNLNGSYFEGAVVLIAVHDENGTFGLMLNRSSHMPLQEVFNPVPDVVDVKRPFYIGGPVDEEGLHLLHICSEFDTNNGLQIVDGLELGGEWDNIEEILQSDPSKTLLFLGYSGWDAGQLEDELEEGSWNTYTPDLLELLNHLPQMNNYSKNNIVELLSK